MRTEYRRRRDLAVELALENELSVSYPHGAFYMLVDISAQPKDSISFCCDLLDAEHLAVAPGRSFGERCDGYVRISLCADAASLEAGIPRLADYLHRLADRAQPESCVCRATAAAGS
jgi:aspartate/methionine/tyrosine aminotransferase